MAGELAYEVRVFYLLIQIADKGASGHVAACYVGYALVFGLSIHRIKDRDSPLYATEVENFLYRIVVLLL